MGMSQNIAGLYVEMTRAFNQSKVKSREGRRPGEQDPDQVRGFRRGTGARIPGRMSEAIAGRASS
jgi:hypothetical protein